MNPYYTEPDNKLVTRRLKEYSNFFIGPFFPKDTSIKILDVGCGYGLFLKTCEKAGYLQYEGVDTDKPYTDYATKHLGLKNVHCANAQDYLRSKNEAFYDIIVAFNILEHIRKENVQEFLSLLYRGLTSNGMVILEIPNAQSPLGISTFYSDITHEFAYTPKLLNHLLSLAGFTSIKVIPKYVNTNSLIRFGQKILAKIIGLDDKIYFSGNLVAIAKKI